MTQRERSMMFLLLGVAGVAVLGGVVLFGFIRPMADLNRKETELTAAIDEKNRQHQEHLRNRKLVAVARERSLATNAVQANIDYGKYLDDLFTTQKFTDVKLDRPKNVDPKPVAGAAKGKKPLFTTLSYTVQCKGNLEQVVSTLKKLQDTPALHRVKSLTLNHVGEKDTNDGKLAVVMTIEAMIMHSVPADHKPKLVYDNPKIEPPGTNEKRDYDLIKRRNFFLGYIPVVEVAVKPPDKDKTDEPPPTPKDDLDVRHYVRLEHTTPSASEAFMRNYLWPIDRIKSQIRMKVGDKDYGTFGIRNERDTESVVQGKVLHVAHRDVYFQVGEKVYGISLGQTVFDAMQTPLSSKEVDALGLKKKAPEKEKAE